MDLQLAFAQLTPQDPAFEQRVQHTTTVRHPSQHPLWKLRRAIRINLVFGTVITLGYAMLLPMLGHALIIAFFLVVMAYNVWALLNTYQLYRRLPASVSALNDLRTELNAHVAASTAWMRLHQRTALLTYPLAVTGGFLFGGLMGSGLSPVLFMSRPTMWLWLLGSLVVLVPLCHLLVKWMNRTAFGVHVDALRARIAELEGRNT